VKSESRDAKSLHQGRRFNYQAVKAYLEQYIDVDTGLFDSSYMEYRACPVCEGKDTTFMFVKSGGQYVSCNGCSMVFTNPTFRSNHLDDYYANLNTGQGKIVENESEFYKEIYGLGLNLISEAVVPGTLLDIGCSTGYFLDLARNSGWDTFGIEPGVDEAAIARDRGHRIFDIPLSRLDVEETFDVISLWDVFEHVPDPHGFLKDLTNHLVSKGVIYMQIPNSGGLAPRILHERCNMFDGLEHCNLYNPITIEKVLRCNGFEISAMESVISEGAVLANYLSYSDPYFGDQIFGGTLLDVLDEERIHNKLLGYKLQIVAKKA